MMVNRFFNRPFYFNKSQCWLITLFVLFTNLPTVGQPTLTYGENSLIAKNVNYQKYTATITPWVILRDQYSNKFNILFEISWTDKKGRYLDLGDDLFAYLIDYDRNIDKYCLSKGLEFVDGRDKETKYKYPISFTIQPENQFILSKLTDGFLKTKSETTEVVMNNYYTSKISLIIRIYFCKIKKGEFIILSNSDSFRWEFFLPEKKSDEGLSCEELIRKYTSQYTNTKPAYWGFNEAKYSRYEEDGADLEKWQDLAFEVNNYRSSLLETRSILERLEGMKDTIFCKEINTLKYDIRSSLTLQNKVEELSAKINEKIISLIDNMEQSETSTTVPLWVYNVNSEKMLRYYLALWDAKTLDGSKVPFEQLIQVYSDSIQVLKQNQDSILSQAGELIPGSLMAFHVRNFDHSYNEVIKIINENKTEAKIETIEDASSIIEEKSSQSTRKFPIVTIVIVGLVMLLVVIGVWKFFPFFKKILHIKGKTKK